MKRQDEKFVWRPGDIVVEPAKKAQQMRPRTQMRRGHAESPPEPSERSSASES